MKKYISIFFTALTLSTGLSSCEDMLTEKPDSAYDLAQYFTSEAKAEMSVMGIYSSVTHPNLYGSRNMATFVSDDTHFTSRTNSDGAIHDMSNYTLASTNKWVSDLWKYTYEAIDRCNFAIAGITGMENYEKNKALQQLVAEAHFLRAFMAFDLVKYWGDVPFKTTYSSGYESAFNPRTPREAIYDEIIKDLDFAKSNLDWKGNAESPERPGQGAARALLMRVLLQRAGYSLQPDGKLTRPEEPKRTEYFNAVIQEWEQFTGKHNFYAGSYEEFFKTFSEGVLNSQESLFEIALYHMQGSRNGGWWGTYNGPAVAEPVGIEPTETGKYMGRANAFFRAVPEWYDFFAEGDTRRDVNICTYKYNWNKTKKVHEKSKTLRNDSWYPGKWRREWMPIGYKDLNYTDVNYCPLRYADVVLMAAEAYNETGNTIKAWELLNSVRKRAGAPEINNANYAELLKAPKVYDLAFIDDATEQGKFRTALYWERGFELAFEGQRKYDLIRWGILKEALVLFGSNSAVNGSKIPYPAYQNFVTGKHELLPIPLSEIQSNAKLEGKNNNGY